MDNGDGGYRGESMIESENCFFKRKLYKKRETRDSGRTKKTR